jgi:hypothetical protein
VAAAGCNCRLVVSPKAVCYRSGMPKKYGAKPPEQTCPACNGTGVLPVVQVAKPGRRIYHPGARGATARDGLGPPNEALQEKPLSRSQPCYAAIPLKRLSWFQSIITETSWWPSWDVRPNWIDILANAAELCRSLVKSRQTAQEMGRCCDAMQAEMRPGDSMIVARTNGAGMTVRYLLPRPA